MMRTSERGRQRIPTRRCFLKGTGTSAAALVLGLYVPFAERTAVASALAPGIFDPNVFLRIDTDNSVTILSKHFEMGQGITTGLATLVAEELEADWPQMRVAFASNNPKLYNNLAYGDRMLTGGSTSLSNSWGQMRKVGAAARMMLTAAAASKWGVPAEEVEVRKGVVSHRGSKRSIAFGGLAADASEVPVPRNVELKHPKDWKLIGKRLPRLDSIAKTTGSAKYALDVRRPGELIAMVRRPDHFGAKLLSVDDGYARSIPGVVDVVRVPSGVAVLATDTWSAMTGRKVLGITWDTDTAELRSTPEILEDYRRLAEGPEPDVVRRGDAAAALAEASQVLEAEFTFPYMAHAPMEPINAVMELRPGGGAEIWSGCQAHSADALAAATVLGLAPEQIMINTVLGGGSFGRRDSRGDWMIELAEIAKAIGGRSPVHLVWTREDDIRGGYYRPLTLHRVKVGLDAAGHLSGWHHKVVCQSLFEGTRAEELIAMDGFDRGSVGGLADMPYEISDLLTESYNAQSPVPVLWWRSVAHSHTAHAIETTLDELARRAGKDPVLFRRKLLAKHPRDLVVLNLAAEKAGWGRPLARHRGRGIAYHRCFNTRVAMVAEVTMARTSYRVDRVVCAVDCGIAVNPDIIEAQIEGAIGFALSSVLRNAITLNKGVVEQANFDDYDPTRFSEMPKVEVHIVKSLTAPSGIGEPGVPPLAPAIGNAIAAATGKRLYSLPFDATLRQ
ncbi:MAG: xanthine dehydrogenase family protein molybdopterin-binding subunit [Hyphomicrobiaceae bacterium]